MASHTHDDGFHEIQLNGKQLVFVFMALTVVSVVIFLCGVLVGRGVRAERIDAARVTAPSAVEQLKDSVNLEKPPTVQQNQDPTKAAPPTPAEGGSQETPVPAEPAVRPPSGATETAAAAATAGTLRPEQRPAREARPVPAAGRTATSAPPAAVREAAAAAPGGGLPAPDEANQGWVVQVAATKTRGEAETMVKALKGKGYAAFVSSNNPNVFRVRVGGYKNRRDADTVAAKLRRDERIDPWVTR